MKHKKLIFSLLTFFICFQNTFTVFATGLNTITSLTPCAMTSDVERPKIDADVGILVDATTGTILYQKNIKEACYPASITKILTTLIAVERCNLDEMVSFSKNAVFGIEKGSSHIAINVGEELNMRDCLYGVMLASANEVAYAVAEHIGGSMEGFAKIMNKRAKEIGIINSNFVNSNGLHDDNHYTCAYDMALITREAIQNKDFRVFSSTLSYVIPPTNLQPESRPVNMKHCMWKPSSEYYYSGTEGGKTGYTDKARTTLMTYAKRGDLELICIIMKGNGTNVYKDTATLFNYGFDNYTLVKPDIGIGASTDNWQSKLLTPCLFNHTNGILNLTSSSDFSLLLPLSASMKKITAKVNLNINTQEQCLGEIEYYYNNKLANSTKLFYTINTPFLREYPKRTLKNFIFEHNLQKYIPFILSGLVIFLLTIVLIFILHFKRKRRKKNHYVLKYSKKNKLRF